MRILTLLRGCGDDIGNLPAFMVDEVAVGVNHLGNREKSIPVGLQFLEDGW